MDLHRTLLKDVIMPKIKSVYVTDYYEGVRGLLESRGDFPYKDIFANPRVRTRTEIVWNSDAFVGKPKILSVLRGDEKDYYSYLLYKELSALRTLIETLKTEEGGAPLAELLSKAISDVDEDSVYCGDAKIVLVNWGLIPRQTSLGGGSIFRSGKFIGGWDKAHGADPKAPKPGPVFERTEPVQEPVTPRASEKPDTPEKASPDPVDAHRDSPSGETVAAGAQEKSSASKEKMDVPPVDGLVDPCLSEGEKVDAPVSPAREKEVVTEERPEKESAEGSEEDSESEKKVIDGKARMKKEKVGVRKPEYGWAQLFGGFWSGLMFLLKKLWWILAVALLALLCLVGFRDCQGPFSQINPFYDPLPKTPEIMPIEKDNVGMSEDGMYQVATDRLNIMLEKEDDGTMLEWAKAFKKAYPSSDFEIKYYNDDTYTLQVKVPSAERVRVMKELNSKLPEFGFEVYEETVYQTDFVADDPALKDPQASWYLKAIGAQQAWDITQGDEEVIVAVVDNGFDLTHPEFEGKIVKPYNVLTRDGNVRPIVTREGVNAHGTHVAATAVGNCNNGSGLLGLAPKCRFMPVQVANDNPTGSMSGTAIMEGVLYAIDNGADVVNVSLGMYTPDQVKNMTDGEQLNYIANTFRQEESLWEEVIRRARAKDCIIVFAAGNDNVISGIDPKKRNSNTIRVSAVSPNSAKASFSNYGRYPDINRDYSTVSAPGVAIYSAAPGGQYQYMQGTSMAAPVVTGAVALLRSANRGLTADEAIGILQETGRTVDPSIGPVIQIGDAMKAVKGEKAPAQAPARDCGKIRAEVQRLRAQIDSLTRLCPGAAEPADTLKYDDVVSDPSSLDGTWRSTTQMYNTSDNSPIELYMTFSNLTGQLVIVNKGLRFTAPIRAAIEGNEIHISQSGPAKCPEDPTSFMPYTYECAADRKRNLLCDAKSTANRINFNLVRIQ